MYSGKRWSDVRHTSPYYPCAIPDRVPPPDVYSQSCHDHYNSDLSTSYLHMHASLHAYIHLTSDDVRTRVKGMDPYPDGFLRLGKVPEYLCSESCQH